jgi:hypothetical protein
MQIDADVERQQWRFDFEIAARIEEAAGSGKEFGPTFEKG